MPAESFTVNGPTEILAVTNTQFLVLERSFSVGVVGNQVRLYEVDITNATNGAAINPNSAQCTAHAGFVREVDICY